MDLNHIVFIVMDSCRYDAFVAAATPNMSPPIQDVRVIGPPLVLPTRAAIRAPALL